MNRSEIEVQIDAAHRHPRSTRRWMRRALDIATVSVATAESCVYTLPRMKKDPKTGKMVPIRGPSVRMAEICASSYGNLHVGARPTEVGRSDVTAQGVAWDLETNFRVTIEAKRRITKASGERYGEDMILVTQQAATSIALRNAVFRVIPRGYVDTVYTEVKKVALEGGVPLDKRRMQVIDRLGAIGVSLERALAVVEKAGIEDIGLDELETLIGLGTAVKQGDATIDEAFPDPSVSATIPEPKPGEQGRRVSLGRKKQAAAATPEPTPAPTTEKKPETPAAITPEQREQDTQDEARAEQEDKGDDPLLDHARRQSPPPSDDDEPSWMKKAPRKGK
jgi:hypothetical protein